MVDFRMRWLNGPLLLCYCHYRDAVNLGHDGIYSANKDQRLNRQHTTQHTCGEAVHLLFMTLQIIIFFI